MTERAPRKGAQELIEEFATACRHWTDPERELRFVARQGTMLHEDRFELPRNSHLWVGCDLEYLRQLWCYWTSDDPQLAFRVVEDDQVLGKFHRAHGAFLFAAEHYRIQERHLLEAMTGYSGGS